MVSHPRLDGRLRVAASGCIEWTGPLSRGGYGRIRPGSSTRGIKKVQVHRFAWEVENGPIPDGLFVCHKCDNRICCNLDHLFLGTLKDNVDDMVAKERQARGIKNANAVLTEAQVASIKRRLADGVGPVPLSVEYGVSDKAIYRIRDGVTWKHIAPERPVCLDHTPTEG